MAILSDINLELVSLVNGALTAAGINNVEAGTEWPPKDVLQDVGKDTTPILAIIHRMTSYQAKNMRFQHSINQNPCGIQSSVSDFSIAPGQSVTLTISFASGSSAVNVNDMVSCNLSNGELDEAITYTAPSGATLSSVAAGLASAIHSTFPAIAAIASGATITITNNDVIGYHIASSVSNTTNIAETVKWACRSIQINVWSGDLTTKFNIQKVIEALLIQLDDAHGFALPSTEWVELKFNGAKPDDAETDKDVYMDSFLFTIDHMIDITQEYWPVIAPIQENYWS